MDRHKTCSIPEKYWSTLKVKLKKKGSELSHNLGQLKIQSEDAFVSETVP